MKVEYSQANVSFSGLLTIAFIVLKLTETINWSWWWVLSPLWIPAVLALVIATFAVILGLIFNKQIR